MIDPDALEALFHGRDTDGSVQFIYEELDITVRNDGTVDVQQASPQIEPMRRAIWLSSGD